MKNKIRNFVLGCTCALGAASASAQSAVFEDTFRSFSVCDAGFFKTLQRESKSWSEIAPLDTQAEISRIRVADRTSEQGNHVAFSRPPVVAGLKFTSYFDQVSDLGDMGMYYYWGFLVSGDVDDVAAKLSPLVHASGRLRKGSEEFVRTEVKVPGSRWLPIDTKVGTPAGMLRIERVFSIEPEGEKPTGVVRVSCSLQGGVTGAILKEERPDIDQKDYPAQMKTAFFDDAPIPADVVASLDVARGSNELWKPKFKKIIYTTKTKSSSLKDSEMTVEVEAQKDGLLRTRETYSPTFNVQRLMLAQLVNLKSRMNAYSDGRVYVAKNLQLALPAALQPGAVISLSTDAEYVPKRAGDALMHSSWKCEAKERFDASKIFSTLSGQAVSLACETIGPNRGTTTKAFIEDLGLVVELASESSQFGSRSSVFTRFEVERDVPAR
jgi:hypothetical protein